MIFGSCLSRSLWQPIAEALQLHKAMVLSIPMAASEVKPFCSR